MTNQHISIAFLLSFFFLANYSHANQDLIRCPDLETMHQSANLINEATLVNGNYIANTDPFAIHYSDIGWFAVVYGIRANSTDEAMDKARLAMQSISTVSSVIADNLGGIYRCRYDNDRIQTLSNDDDWRLFKARIHALSTEYASAQTETSLKRVL